MNTTVKVLIALFAAGFLMFAVTACTAISFNNECVTLEKGIQAQYDKNQVVYDTMWKSVQEVAGVAEAHADKVKEIAIDTIKGRYQDANGQQTNGKLFLAIAEANGQALPADLYKKVQQIIEANRNSFKANQTTLIAKKQTYETKLGVFPGSLYASMMGFPRIDMDEYGIVTSTKTEKTFDSKKEEVAMNPFAEGS